MLSPVTVVASVDGRILASRWRCDQQDRKSLVNPTAMGRGLHRSDDGGPNRIVD